MTRLETHLLPDMWMRQLFSRVPRDGGVVRRRTRDVEQIVGRHLFEAELRRRGFSAVENGGQIVIFCNREPIRQII